MQSRKKSELIAVARHVWTGLRQPLEIMGSPRVVQAIIAELGITAAVVVSTLVPTPVWPMFTDWVGATPGAVVSALVVIGVSAGAASLDVRAYARGYWLARLVTRRPRETGQWTEADTAGALFAVGLAGYAARALYGFGWLIAHGAVAFIGVLLVACVLVHLAARWLTRTTPEGLESATAGFVAVGIAGLLAGGWSRMPFPDDLRLQAIVASVSVIFEGSVLAATCFGIGRCRSRRGRGAEAFEFARYVRRLGVPTRDESLPFAMAALFVAAPRRSG